MRVSRRIDSPARHGYRPEIPNLPTDVTMSVFQPASSNARFRHLAAIACVFAYLVTTLGIPIPANSAKTMGSADLAPCGCPLDAERAGTCCCRPNAHEAVHACCSKKTSSRGTPPTKSLAKSPTLILAMAARQCQGLASIWLSIDVALSPPPATDAVNVSPSGSLLSFQPTLLVVVTDPPVPPPRIAAPSLA